MEKITLKTPETFEESMKLSMKGYANNLRKIRKPLEVKVGLRTKENYIAEEGWDLPDRVAGKGYKPGIYTNKGSGKLKVQRDTKDFTEYFKSMNLRMPGLTKEELEEATKVAEEFPF